MMAAGGVEFREAACIGHPTASPCTADRTGVTTGRVVRIGRPRAGLPQLQRPARVAAATLEPQAGETGSQRLALLAARGAATRRICRRDRKW